MTTSPTESAPVSRRLKLILSLLCTLHLLAVVVPPFTFATRTGYESSPLAQFVMSLVQPYSNAMYLNHGYFFFAPSPGPSHIIEYDVHKDEENLQTYRIPDHRSQWPRLYYHRHLMLAEWLHSNFPPATVPDWIEPEEDRRQHEIYTRLLQSYQDHLLNRHQAHQVTVRRLEHELVDPSTYQQEKPDLFAHDRYKPLPVDPAPSDAP